MNLRGYECLQVSPWRPEMNCHHGDLHKHCLYDFHVKSDTEDIRKGGCINGAGN